MKYFSIETVINAYKGFQDCMTNKSWGYLALLKGCKDSIRPSVPYEVDLDMVSNFLEGIFNLSQSKRSYDSGRTLYVVFSNKWDHYFNDQGRYSPNIYDVIAWAYRRKSFSDNITSEDIVAMFAKEFNIPSNIITNSFNTKAKTLTFINSLYSESQLKNELSRIGVDVTSNNIDAKKGGVVAAPGEISRGPFVQTLYAGLEISDYVIIMQSDYSLLYGNGKDILEKDNAEDIKRHLQQIYYGAPGTGKSFGVDNVCKKHLHYRVTFHPDTDYSSFVGCYKPKSHKKNLLKGNGINETQLLSSFFDSNSPKYNRMNKARYLYEALIHTKDIRDLGLDAQSVADKLNAKGFGGCAYTTEATCMYNIYDWLVADGFVVENSICYEFVPQAFTKAYLDAWKHQADGIPVFLIIEEINRGNCAQIFGDLFQLLDRDKDGFSRYEISPDNELQEYINGEGLVIKDIYDSDGNDISDKIASGELMKLPNNLYIWATMNTSDQSLFPIDSAFKRRWDWKYIPIDTRKEQWDIVAEGVKYSWTSFLDIVNKRVLKVTLSEDKQLGFYFCKAQNNVVSTETFVGKVLFYLWNDVFKDYEEAESIFRDSEGKQLPFSKFYNTDGNVNEAMVTKLLVALGIEKSNSTDAD